jgi:hypothetical protein
MADALAFEKSDEHGNPVKWLLAPRSAKPWKATKQCAEMVEMPASSDEDDHDYEDPGTSQFGTVLSTSSNSNRMLPSNAEVSSF